MVVVELAEVHVNDIGTLFKLTLTDDSVAVDISGATTKQIKLKKPDGTVLTKTAIFTTDGTDGKMFYQTIADDIDVTGEWQIQGYVVLATGTWYTSVHSFRVFENL